METAAEAERKWLALQTLATNRFLWANPLNALQFARDMDTRLAEKFVGMYVNHYTVDCGDVVPKAAQKLLDLGHEVGLIPQRIEVEFVR